MTNLPPTVRAVAARFPAIVPHLRGYARWIAAAAQPEEYKTQDFYLQRLQNLVRSVYANLISGEFVDIMANLVSGQLRQAFTQAWADEGETGDLPGYLAAALEEMILSEYTHVDAYYRDIVDARIDGTPIEPLLIRAQAWANRYTDAYNRAVALITEKNGGNLIWQYGQAEHCDTCLRLNGIVARASEWAALGVRPQNPPNPLLTCQGWNCKCSLVPTDKRRSPKAYNRIASIVGR